MGGVQTGPRKSDPEARISRLNCRIDGWLGSERSTAGQSFPKYPPGVRQGQAQRRAPVYQAVSILSGGLIAGCVRCHLC
jgi:hypothetical protein